MTAAAFEIPAAARAARPAPRFTVQVVTLWYGDRKTTHGRQLGHSFDRRHNLPTLCGKPTRHTASGGRMYEVVANTHPDDAIDRITCVACQGYIR